MGKKSILEIADILNVPMSELYQIYLKLYKRGLVKSLKIKL